MDAERLPADVRSTMASFLTAELTTVSAKGSPQTWPVLPSIEWKSGRIVIATSIGLPQKAYNIRRRPDVSLLFSEPTGSGLTDPLSVLIEGSAEVSDTLFTSLSQIDDADVRAALDRDALALLRRQPAVGIYASNPVARIDGLVLFPTASHGYPAKDFVGPRQPEGVGCARRGVRCVERLPGSTRGCYRDWARPVPR